MRIIIGLLCFGFIVMVHEFGHFIFAKRGGVTIHEFSIGMGPKLFSREKGGTEYSLRLFPIGGYVAMEGEDESSDNPGSFGNASMATRLKSILAGPVFNIILAFFLLIIVFIMMGTPVNKVDKVVENSPAAVMQLEKGDEIVKIGDNRIVEFEQVNPVLNKIGNKETTLTVKRDGKEITKNFVPKEVSGNYTIGFYPETQKNVFKSVKYAGIKTVQTTYVMLDFLAKLVTGRLPKDIAASITGPVGVLNLVSEASTYGIANVINITAFISLNIGIFNLLPFPALDGWRILMLIIELIRGGKKFDPNKEGMINFVGLSVLMLFMIVITYKDIMRIFFK